MPKKRLENFILEFAESRKYFSVGALKAHIKERNLNYPANTINQYLYNLRTQKKIFDAGRGWYSTLPNVFVLDTEPVQALSVTVKKGYPFLKFSSWSTGQLQSFAHHLQTSFIHFLYVESEATAPVTEYLIDKSYNAYRNPGIREFEKYFKRTDRSVIVRPSLTEEPVKGYYATIEKILVDLYIEKDRTNLMDGSEYKRIFDNLVYKYRINIARMLRYAQRRKVKEALKNKIFIENQHPIIQ